MQIIIDPYNQRFVLLDKNKTVLELKFHRCTSRLYELMRFSGPMEDPALRQELLEHVFLYAKENNINIMASMKFIKEYHNHRLDYTGGHSFMKGLDPMPLNIAG